MAEAVEKSLFLETTPSCHTSTFRLNAYDSCSEYLPCARPPLLTILAGSVAQLLVTVVLLVQRVQWSGLCMQLFEKGNQHSVLMLLCVLTVVRSNSIPGARQVETHSGEASPLSIMAWHATARQRGTFVQHPYWPGGQGACRQAGGSQSGHKALQSRGFG